MRALACPPWAWRWWARGEERAFAHPTVARSLLLDAAGLDQLRPFLLVLVDKGGIVFRRARGDFGAVLRQLPLHLVGGERIAQCLVEPVDDRPRRAGGGRPPPIERSDEPRQHRFGK